MSGIPQAYEEADLEGIAVDAEGILYIAWDAGGIVEYQKKERMEP